MARLRVRMEMNQGGMGVPLQKLAGVAGEAHRFFNMLCEDIRIDTSKGQWLALEFDETSLSFTVEFIGPLNPIQVREFYDAFSGSTPLRKATIGQFARIADSIDEDEMIGFGFYHGDDDTEPHEWRSLSRRDALRIGEEMRSLAEAVERKPESLMPQPQELDHSAAYFRDRRDHGPERAAVEAFLRAVETRIMQRVTRLEADVAGHGVAIHSLKENSAGVEQSMKHLLVAVEDFCDRASEQFSRLPAPAPQLPEPVFEAAPLPPPMAEPAPALSAMAASAGAGAAEAPHWLAATTPLEHGLAGADEAPEDVTPPEPPAPEPAVDEVTGYELLATRNRAVEQPAYDMPQPQLSEPELSGQEVTEEPTVRAAAGPELAEESNAAEASTAPTAAGNEPPAAEPKPRWPWAAAAAAVLAVVGGLYSAGVFDSRPAPPKAAPAAAAVRPTPVSEEAPPQAAPLVAVRLRAGESCWIMVSVGARQSFVGVLDAGQSKSFEATEPIRVRTGNAGGLSIEWNGKPVGSLGPRGQVRIIEFSPSEFKYLPLTPAKPAAASTGS